MSEPIACSTQALRDSRPSEVNAQLAGREPRGWGGGIGRELTSATSLVSAFAPYAVSLRAVGRHSRNGVRHGRRNGSNGRRRGSSSAATSPTVAPPSAPTCDGKKASLEAPAPASPGDHVRLRGSCFTRRYWKTLDPLDGYGIALVATVDEAGRPVKRPRRTSCEFIARARGRFHVSLGGRLRGWFAVPQRGVCFQQETAGATRRGAGRVRHERVARERGSRFRRRARRSSAF